MSSGRKRSSLDVKITTEMRFSRVKRRNEKASTPSGTPKTAAPEATWSDGRIRVGVRVRPARERGQPAALSGDRERIEANVSVGTDVAYDYDRVFWSSRPDRDDQSDVFRELAEPLLEKALEGYNACLFAYGQTGSGKTYSMTGPGGFDCERAGVVPRVCERLFRDDGECCVSVSYYEIYNEKIYDLLADAKVALKVREHPLSGPYVENLSVHRADCYRDAKALVASGDARRVTAATAFNDRSSRSHSILEMVLSPRTDGASFRSKLSLVDLAGSERVALSQASGDRYKEGLSINRSLLTLGKVITCLSDPKKNSFVPYRESVLTWLLKENLGDNSFTAMLATVSPDASALEETLATLRYACRARRIVNRVSVNEDPQYRVIRQLRREIERLKSIKNNVQEKLLKVDKNQSPIVRNLKCEMQRKAVEERLQSEMRRLTADLQTAERRRSELESQRNAFIESAKFGDVSFYKSDFFESLQSILDDSSHVGDSQSSLIRLEEMEKTINALKHSCVVNLEDETYRNVVLPRLTTLTKAYDDVRDVLINLTNESCD